MGTQTPWKSRDRQIYVQFLVLYKTMLQSIVSDLKIFLSSLEIPIGDQNTPVPNSISQYFKYSIAMKHVHLRPPRRASRVKMRIASAGAGYLCKLSAHLSLKHISG